MLKSSEKPEFKQKSAELSENPIERLRQIAGTREKTETQEQALPMTIGRMEEFHNFILKLSQDKFLGGDLPNYYSKFNEPPQRTTEKLYELAEVEDFCREFLNAKESLDSNTKRKLWEKIYKENWQPFLQNTFTILKNDLQELELKKKMRRSPEQEISTEELNFLRSNKSDKHLINELSFGISQLKKFSFPEEKLKELENQFKKVKK